MAKTSPQKVNLTPQDRERMQRLSEEIQGRLEEMGLIMSRTLGVNFGRDALLKFAPSRAEGQAADASPQRSPIHIEIVCAPDGTCGCYVDPPGFCEFPCGAAG